MKTDRIVIVQCRLSSTRLPGKALLQLGDKKVLDWVLEAMHKVKADYYYVATDQASYKHILPLCEKNDFKCFQGSLNDVLQRFTDLLDTVKAKTVIRATADNPFLFYEAAEESVIEFEEKNKAYLSNASEKAACDYLTYSGLPHGSGVEIFLSSSLKKAAEETSDPYDHEHVGPALYNHKDKYTCEFVPSPVKYNFPDLRTTIDTYSDYLRALSIVNYLGKDNGPYSYYQIIDALNSALVKNPIIFAPSVKKGQGTGHLHRCLSAACGNMAFVYIPESKSLEETDSILESYYEKGLSPQQVFKQLPDESYLPVIVSDSFSLTASQIKDFKNNKLLIGIDEASSYTDYCDYLLDIIPSYNLKRKANLFNPELIEKPCNVKSVPQTIEEPVKNVLVCLGGEDPAALSLPAVKLCAKCLPQAKITAVCSQPENFSFGNVSFSEPVKNLREQLFNYDLVITHYGLTAFEAVAAGCKVILLPTTALHVKLAQKYNFAFIPQGGFNQENFNRALHSDKILPKKTGNISDKIENTNLFSTISRISFGNQLVCPVCGKKAALPDKIISRNEKRSYRRCQSCGIVYLSFSCEEEKVYHKAYFFEDYKKQYGRTYEEDFEYIKAQGKRRLTNIKGLCNRVEEKTILDIGCAYGPFLSAASDAGLTPFGTDISDEAISYVQKELHIPAVASAFPDINTVREFGIPQFDIVTMWYVIEHFKNLDSVLSKVESIIKYNGIFAFSTPSGEGVSAVSDKDLFYKNSPTDHFTVWELSRCENILKKYGFKVEKIVSTGHHPERFPLIKNKKVGKNSLLWKLIDKYSKIMRLGDTVEIYCRKIGR